MIPKNQGPSRGQSLAPRCAHGSHLPGPAAAPQKPRARLPLFLEVGVLQGLVGGDSLIGIIGHHCMQEGEALWGQIGCQ